MKIPKGDDVSYSVGSAISLNDSNGKAIPNRGVYEQISQLVKQKAEEYDKEVLSGIFLRVYYVGKLEKEPPLSDDEINTKLMELLRFDMRGGEQQVYKDMGGGEPQVYQDMSVNKEHRSPANNGIIRLKQTLVGIMTFSYLILNREVITC